MNTMLTGIITGLATGASEKIQKEREDTNLILATRTKQANDNYLKLQEEKKAIKEEIKKRISAASAYQSDLTEAQKIAIASDTNNMYLKSYAALVAAGNPYNRKLSDIITLGKDAPASYEEWSKANTEPVVKPTAPTFEQGKSIFSPSSEYKNTQLDKLSSLTGVATNDLMAYEKGVDMPSITQVGSLNMEMLKMPESPEEINNNLFNALSNAKNPEDVAAAKQAIAKHAEKMSTFDTLMGRTDWSKELTDTRAKVYSILADPSQFDKEDVAWATSWNKNDVARQRSASAVSTSKPENLAPYINAAIKMDTEMVPSATAGGVTRYKIGGKFYDQNSPEAQSLMTTVRNNAVKRVLAANGSVEEGGSLNLNPETKLLLSSYNIPTIVINGKTYLGENKVSAMRQAGGTPAVVELIQEALDRGYLKEELIKEGMFTAEELAAAGIEPPVSEPTTTPVSEPTTTPPTNTNEPTKLLRSRYPDQQYKTPSKPPVARRSSNSQVYPKSTVPPAPLGARRSRYPNSPQ